MQGQIGPRKVIRNRVGFKITELEMANTQIIRKIISSIHGKRGLAALPEQFKSLEHTFL